MDVGCDDEGVTLHRPEGPERLAWSELAEVEIVTTDDGPFADDVFWVLHGGGKGLVVPQTAAGTDALLERLQALPGFRNEAVIQAMGSDGPGRFLCWRRPQSERE